MRNKILYLLFFMAFIATPIFGQVEEIKLRMVYDEADTLECETKGRAYVVWLHIVKGSATSQKQFKQFGSQVSIIVPVGTIIPNMIDSTFNPPPILDPTWKKNNVITPAGSDVTYISITEGELNDYLQLNQGDSLKLFKIYFKFPPTYKGCKDKIRLFRNNEIQGMPVSGGDPKSSETNSADFNNGFAIGNIDQLYTGNFSEILGPTTSDIMQACNDGIEINLNLTQAKCNKPYTFSWTGPGGFTANTENVKIPSSMNPQGGIYKVVVTDNLGCTQEHSINVAPPPSAGIDTEICTSTNMITLNGTNPTTGTWTADPSNSGGVNETTQSNGRLKLDFNTPNGGVYKYIYSAGTCEDTVTVTRLAIDAGNNPSQNTCYSSATITTNAVGNGLWKLKSGPSPSATANIISPNQGNTDIDMFSEPGTYIFTWTVGSCSEDITVVVGNTTCACTIVNDINSQNVDSCGSASNINITGPTATPSGGTYQWEVSTDQNNWQNIIGATSDTYTTGLLTPNTYYFRRKYTTAACSLNSNEVIINVKPLPNAGDPQFDLCADRTMGGKVNLNATGNGQWEFEPNGSVGGVSPTFNDFAPNTQVIDLFQEGKYIFRWKENGCEDTTSIEVKFRPDAGRDTSFACTLPSERIANLIADGDGTWSQDPSNPASVTFNNPFSKDVVISNFTKNGIYYFTYGSPSCNDAIEIIVSDPADAGLPITKNCITKIDTIQANAKNGPGFWQKITVPFGGNILIRDNIDANTIMEVNYTDADYQLEWRDNNGCKDTLDVKVRTAPSANGFTTECLDLSTPQVTLGSIRVSSIEGMWTQIDNLPKVSLTNLNGNSKLSNVTTAGKYMFRWTENQSGCTADAEVIVREIPDAGVYKDLSCITLGQGNVTMTATGNGTWSAGNNPGGATITTPSNPQTTITGFFSPGPYTFRYTTNDFCTSEITINVTNKANAGPDDNSQVCVEIADALGSLRAAGSGEWAEISGNPPGGVFIVNPNDPNTKVRNFPTEGIYGFEWTSNNCKDTAYIKVEGKTNAGRDTSFNCVDVLTTKINLDGKGTGGVWSSIPPGLNFDDRNEGNALVSNFKNGGTFLIEWNIKNCRDTVRLFLSPKANAGEDAQNQDCYANGKIFINADGNQMGTWIADPDNPGNSKILTPNNASSQVDGFEREGVYKYIWTTNDNCIDTMQVIVGNNCPCTIASNDIKLASKDTFCIQSGLVKFDGVAATPGPGTYKWEFSVGGPTGPYVNAPGTNNTEDFEIANLNVGTYFFRRIYATTAGFICDVPSNPVTVTVVAPQRAGANDTIRCLDLSTASVRLFTSSTGGEWKSLDGPTIDNKFNASTFVRGFTQDGNYRIELLANGCRDTMEINVRAAAVAKADTILKCISLPLSTLNLSAVGTGNWSKINALDPFNLFNANQANAQITNITSVPINNSDYKLLWTASNGCTDTVNLKLTERPMAGSDDTISCITFPYSLTLNPSLGGTWTNINGGGLIVSNNAVSPINFARKYDFVLTNTGCTDTVSYTVSQAVKGESITPSVSCFQTDQIALSILSGTGTWRGYELNPDTNYVIKQGTISTVTEFKKAGTYKFILSNNGCQDTVTVSVGSNCNCAIKDNFINKPQVALCGSVDSLMIDGIEAQPSGQYKWLIKKDNGLLQDAPGINDQRGITLKNLTPGSYQIARVFSIAACSDTTYQTFVVNPKADAGPDTTFKCMAGPLSFSANAVGTGFWEVNSAIFSVGNPKSIINIQNPGSYNFLWNSAGCIDTFKVNVTQGVDALGDTTFSCISSTSVFHTINAIGTGVWSSNPTNPTNVIYDDRFVPKTNINIFNNQGTYRLYYKSPSGCVDSIEIKLSKEADAGTYPPFTCLDKDQLNNIKLQASGAGSWTSIDTSVQVTLPSFANTTLSGIDTNGIYKFVWAISPTCMDTATIVVSIKPDLDQALPIQCFSTGSSIITANTSGTWIKNPTNADNSFSIADVNALSTTVNGFANAGVFSIIRRDAAGCQDTLDVNVGNTCSPCNITNNIITPVSTVLCDDPGSVIINSTIISGNPAGSTRWLVSKNGGPFGNAPGQNTSVNYNELINLFGPGVFTFRKIFTTTAPPICSDTSNAVTITINGVPTTGGNRTVLCFSRDSAIMGALAAQGYKWQFVSANVPNPIYKIESDTVPNTKIFNFGAPGNYLFRWTNGICSTNINIDVQDKCNVVCNNIITDNKIAPDTIAVCVNNQGVYYNPPAAQPIGGEYLWQSRFNNGPWLQATGVYKSRDYKPFDLVVGTHKFRRIYILGQCVDTSNEVTAIILPAPSAPIINAPITVCEGERLTLSSPLTVGINYQWRGPNGFISQQREPFVNNVTSLNEGKYTLYVEVTGCISDTVEQFISVKKKPQTPRAISNLPICEGDLLKLKAVPSPNVTFNWKNPFDNVISKDSIVINNARSNDHSGTFVLTADSLGCPSSPVNIFVAIRPQPKLSVSKPTLKCYLKDSVQVSVVDTSAGIWRKVSNSDVFTIGNGKNPILKDFGKAGSYSVIWDNGACPDTISFIVQDICNCIFPENVIIQPDSSFYCEQSDDITILGKGLVSDLVDYKWLFVKKDTTFSEARGKNDEKDYFAGKLDTTSNFRRIMILKDEPGCKDTSNQVFVNVIKQDDFKPIVDLGKGSVCVGDSISIEWKNAIPNVKFSWSVTSELGILQIPTVSKIKLKGNEIGIGEVRLKINEKGCTDAFVDENIMVLGYPSIDLGPDTFICRNDKEFSELLLDLGPFTDAVWNDGSKGNSFTVRDTGTFFVKVTNGGQCSVTDSIKVSEFCCKVDYPNIIKLSGSDANKKFKILQSDCVLSSKLKIFDRWGNLVYLTEDLSPWDGKFNGEDVNQGVYVFILEYEFIDFRGNKANRKLSGDITVLR